LDSEILSLKDNDILDIYTDPAYQHVKNHYINNPNFMARLAGLQPQIAFKEIIKNPSNLQALLSNPAGVSNLAQAIRSTQLNEILNLDPNTFQSLLSNPEIKSALADVFKNAQLNEILNFISNAGPQLTSLIDQDKDLTNAIDLATKNLYSAIKQGAITNIQQALSNIGLEAWRNFDRIQSLNPNLNWQGIVLDALFKDTANVLTAALTNTTLQSILRNTYKNRDDIINALRIQNINIDTDTNLNRIISQIWPVIVTP